MGGGAEAEMTSHPDNDGPAAVFFEFPCEDDAFVASLTSAIRSIQRKFVREHISEENMQRFRHGTAWTYRANSDAGSGNLQTLSSGWEVKFEDIITGDLSLIEKSLLGVSEDMQRQFMQMMYATISDACDRVGNVVDGKQTGSIAASFVEMLRKIELTVSRDGQVHMPQIHVSPETGEKMLAELKAQPPEFEEEVERIKAEKIALAHQRERERRARYKRYEDNPEG